ncbi:MAG TPA: hypothetical protein VGQ33_10800, partial [Vicinamibacteria bacterium]|nr:hypothetical protein [Vicinamibacteria bacterium]
RRQGASAWGAACAGLILGGAFLVRESALFGLPATLALLPGRRAVAWCASAFLAFGLVVYAPLSIHRAPGGANFWVPTAGKAFGYQAVADAREGRLRAGAAALAQRARANVAEVMSGSRTEKGFLLTFLAMPSWALAGWRRQSRQERRYYAALALGWLGIVGLLVGVYVLGRWSGFRYLMVLMPGFLPAFASPAGRGRGLLGWWPALVLFGSGLALVVSTERILDPFKATSSGVPKVFAFFERQFEGHLPRTVLYGGYAMALADPPGEAITTLPENGAQLRMLERAVWFDYAILKPGSDLRKILDRREHYRLINGDDGGAMFRIYARTPALP